MRVYAMCPYENCQVEEATPQSNTRSVSLDQCAIGGDTETHISHKNEDTRTVKLSCFRLSSYLIGFDKLPNPECINYLSKLEMSCDGEQHKYNETQVQSSAEGQSTIGMINSSLSFACVMSCRSVSSSSNCP